MIFMAKRTFSRKRIYTFQKGAKVSSKWLLIVCLSLISVFFVGNLHIQESETAREVRETEALHQQFIQQLVPYTQEANRMYGVLPSISLAQAILESDWGTSGLAANYYNLYGIKGESNAPFVDLETSEFHNGEWIKITGRFRVFESWRESVLAHAQLMALGVTWDETLYHKVLAANHYQEAARELVNAGYATDPSYAEKIIQIIEQYHLDKYDIKE